ncbi:hypothetical protein [Paracoccus aminovorans]|uniref:hypothetical protein n=1 Tax=Paracoccus aminovorans TaxID=34004 RepID=UPI000783CF8D|nr:hypothetical protein [Paracoccus aminovorans]
MLKHRGFPGRLPGTDFQFIIRRANKKGATPLIRRERFRDRKPVDKRADTAFLAALIAHFGDEPFERGNLDAGRLSWLLGREVVAVGKLDPTDYEQLLRVDMKRAEAGFPELFAAEAPEFDWDDEADWDEDDIDEDGA